MPPKFPKTDVRVHVCAISFKLIPLATPSPAAMEVDCCLYIPNSAPKHAPDAIRQPHDRQGLGWRYARCPNGIS
jgi:hypothetical protein